MTVKHPARYTPTILAKMKEVLPSTGILLDPFAGTGLIHTLATPDRYTIGIEIEPEWATIHDRTIVGDATALPLSAESVDIIATSPTYGNRFADSHTARDGSVRRSYTHDLGRKLNPNNTGQMHWGQRYRDMHARAWMEARRVLKPGGMFILNCKNHIKQFEEVQVTEWHLDILKYLGFEVQVIHLIEVTGMGFGANGQSRVNHESVVVLTK